MKKLKEELKYGKKGITLISLVVTIIVLIILASVTINVLFGENGLITMAQKAKNEYEEAAKNEEQVLAGIFGKNFADYNGQLHVEGAKLMNEHNEIVQLKGIVLGGRDYIKNYTYDDIEQLKKFGINLIRIGLATDYYNNLELEAALYNIIDYAINLDMYIDVIYWNNGDPNQNMESAQEYFEKLLDKYNNIPNIIFEINNETSENEEWNDIESYANNIIPIIREKSNAVIIVGTLNGCTNLRIQELEYKNIMYSFHYYPYSGESNRERELNELVANTLKNVPIFISEWSVSDSRGTSLNKEETDRLIGIINDYNISWCYYTLDYGEYKFCALNRGTDISIEENLTESGKYLKEVINNNRKYSYNWIDYSIYHFNTADRGAFWSDEYINKITSIEILNSMDIPDNVVDIWGISYNGSGKVIGYIVDDGKNNNTYKAIIASNDQIYLPEDASELFYGFENLEKINLEKLNVSYTVNLKNLFYRCRSLKSIDINMWDTSKVKNMGSMFGYCNQLQNIQLNQIDVSSVQDMSAMFDNCSSLRELDISNWDLSNVSKFDYTFYNTGLENLYINKMQENISSENMFYNTNTNVYTNEIETAKQIKAINNNLHVYYKLNEEWKEYVN